MNYLRVKHNPTVFSSQSEKRQSWLLTQFCVLHRILCQVFYNWTLTNSNLPHNRGHDFRKIITLQGCPNLAHHKLSRSAEVIIIITPYLRENRSGSASRCTRHFDNGKTSPARPPGVPTP